MASVLILEDDFDLATSWRSLMQAAGHTVLLASSTKEAQAIFKAKSIDVAIIDLMIKTPEGEPTDSGIHFLRWMKSEDLVMPRLIGVSGYQGSDEGAMAATLLKVYGVDHIMLKPFDPQELVALL